MFLLYTIIPRSFIFLFHIYIRWNSYAQHTHTHAYINLVMARFSTRQFVLNFHLSTFFFPVFISFHSIFSISGFFLSLSLWDDGEIAKIIFVWTKLGTCNVLNCSSDNTYSESTKSIRTKKIFFKKTLFFKIKYYPMRHRIDVESISIRWFQHDDFNLSIRRLIDNHFLLSN